MVSEHTRSVADRAKAIYEEQLRLKLEEQGHGKFVAIEPESGTFFLGESYSEAVMAARKDHPERISFVIRVGYEAAIHIGVMTN